MNHKTRSRYYIGTGNSISSRTGELTSHARECIDSFLYRCADIAGGYTVTNVQGGWIDGEEGLVDESSICVEVIHNDYFTHERPLDEAAEGLRRLLGEGAILLTREPVRTKMIGTE